MSDKLNDIMLERMFRWIRESVAFMHAHHKHPVPMTALIFTYIETFGKALLEDKEKKPSSEEKVCKFVREYMKDLCNALDKLHRNFDSEIELQLNSTTVKNVRIGEILGNYYRNGLVHQFWMKGGLWLIENVDGIMEYVVINKDIKDEEGKKRRVPFGINIDYLVPDFFKALSMYHNHLKNKEDLRQKLYNAIREMSS